MAEDGEAAGGYVMKRHKDLPPAKLSQVVKCCTSCCAGNGEPAAKRQKTVSAKLPTAIVLDIEGTVAPISFVTEVWLLKRPLSK